ncbi:hypothetical protein [Thorsellia anophelis]|uniref:Uncharacterized protein n=1 Tax=Thorsellia anophelis DSM 18579 TaxID=1123402 RepID=A0A1I0FG34_9GAMM|nr:hypothetical protein [Thorsellia anophelis]SET57154.1 hypothetical protein SAMN02583745_02753 [Thorsellia anophelis DSM 18579]
MTHLEEKSFQQSEIETSYKLVKEDLENPQQGETMKQRFLTRQSRYQPQVKLWEYDLPEKGNIQEFKPRALFLNKLTEEYCELPQFYPYIWSGFGLNGVLMCLIAMVPIYNMIQDWLNPYPSLNIKLSFLILWMRRIQVISA